MSDKEADIPVNEIICGDCLEVMRDWPDGCVDLVLTDPPYGIGWNTNYSRFSKGSSDKAPVKNDDKAFDPTPFLRFPVVILFGANHFAKYLPPASWLIWDKHNADGTAFLSDAEVAWWSYGHGILIKTISGQWHRATGGGLHPTQKPLSLMEWCLTKAKTTGLVLDPFCGSGTICVAAKKLGRKYIGIDINPEYCEIARKRLKAVETGVPVKEADAGQMAIASLFRPTDNNQ